MLYYVYPVLVVVVVVISTIYFDIMCCAHCVCRKLASCRTVRMFRTSSKRYGDVFSFSKHIATRRPSESIRFDKKARALRGPLVKRVGVPKHQIVSRRTSSRPRATVSTLRDDRGERTVNPKPFSNRTYSNNNSGIGGDRRTRVFFRNSNKRSDEHVS